MKRLPFSTALITVAAAFPVVQAQLILTEIQSNQSAANSGDYWELTNAGTSSVDIGGYRWTDFTGGNTFANAVAVPAGTSIGAGESIIFTHASESQFRTWWGASVASGVRIFPTPAGDPGLGSADGITLYNSAGTAVIQFSYAAGGFTRLDGSASIGGHAGPSARPTGSASLNHTALVWVAASGTTSPRYTAADGTTQGTFQAAAGADLGSPGYSGTGGSGPSFSLSVSVTLPSFSESAANPATAGTVTRTGDLTSALVVTLASSDPTEATVPATVTIPANQVSVDFSVNAVDDSFPDGSKSVTITASASGANAGTTTLTVQDDGDVLATKFMLTEVLSDQTSTAAGTDDYWELTNFGTSAVSLEGYSWHDSGRSPGSAAAWKLPAGSNIAAGESVIFTVADPVAFRAWWNISPNVQVFQTVGAPGLGKGDGISFFDPQQNELFFFSYAGGGFLTEDGNLSTVASEHTGLAGGGATESQALVWIPSSGTTSPRYTAATGSNFGSFNAASGSDIGSPGVTLGHPAVSINDVNIVEGDSGQTVAQFTVTRSETTTGFTIGYAVTGGTAAAGIDFETVSGTLTFVAGGAASQVISIPVYGDLAGEPDETVIVTLSNLVQTDGTTVIAKSTGTLTITNDDPIAPSLITTPVSPTVVNGNTATLTLAVGGNPAPTIQWYRGLSGDASNPVGTNSSTFVTPVLNATTRYWARITNSAGSVDTGTIVVTIGSAPSGIDLSNYVRVGRHDLPEPTRTTPPMVGNLLCQEASAVTYNWDTDTLFITGDGGKSITQVSKDGQLIDTMTLAAGSSPQGTAFYDPEGITYVGNGEFVISEERDRQLVKFTYAAGTTLTRAQTKTVKIGTFVDNTGTEGLSWDPQTNGFICLKEISPIGIFQTNVDFDAGTATNGSPTTVNSTNLFDPALMGFSDVADVFALSNLPFLDGRAQSENLIVLSQENARIINIDRTGNISSSLQLVSDPGNPLTAANQQHEGITMDRDGIIYVVNENGGGDIDHPQLWVYAPSSVPNQAPTAIALNNAMTSIDENTPTVNPVKVADVVVTDDGLGGNQLSVSGDDAAAFEVNSSGLFIKAGVILDFETKTTYNVTINVDDTSIGSTPDASVTFTLNVNNLVNETPVPTIIISEVAPWSSTNSPFEADWFEVTNTGATPVDITGWKVDDSSNAFGSALALNGVTSIAPGESVIFLETSASNQTTIVNGFKSAWFGSNPPAGLQVGTYNGGSIGLSTGGDAVYLFNPSGAPQAGVTFGASPAGPRFSTFNNAAGLNNTAISLLSKAGVHGAFVAANDPNEIGSPGTTGGLFISEVAPWGSGSTPYAFDWFEMTNNGARTIDLAGWRMDDSSNDFVAGLPLNGVSSIAPGESVIFIETANAGELSSKANTFLTTWFGASHPIGFKIGSYSGGGAGLSTGGDAVNLFDSAGNRVTGVAFGSAASGPFASFENQGKLGSRVLPLPVITSLSAAGKNGAFAALNDGNEVGSPGSTGGVRITEIAPWASGDSPVGADWFELTNFSATAIDLTGWKIDDSSESPVGSAAMTGVGVLAPGESAIFIETATPETTIPAFRSNWFAANPPVDLQIGSYTGGSVGLSSGGDAVNVFSSNNAKQASVSFGGSSSGPLFTTFENATGLNLTAISKMSQPGLSGAFLAKGNANEAGSPGTISGSGQLSLAAWLEATGLTSSGDTDGDGVPNLLEFAFGLNPRGSDNAPTTADVEAGLAGERGMPAVYSQSTSGGRDFRVVFVRRQGSGLTYIPQFSSDLVTWETSNTPVTVIAQADGFEAVTIPYPFFVNGRKAQFFRVTVTENP